MIHKDKCKGIVHCSVVMYVGGVGNIYVWEKKMTAISSNRSHAGVRIPLC